MSDSTEGKDQHEPSMEEILASIRRIISEDGDGGEGGDTAAAPKAEETPAAEPAPADTLAAALEPPPIPAPAAAPPLAAEAERPKRAPIADVEAEDESDILLLTEEAADEPPPAFRDSPPARDENEPPPEPPYRVPEPLTFELDAEPEPEPVAAPARAAASEPVLDLDRLISDRAAAASLAAMTELVSRSHREPNIESLPMGNANQTLEDLTRELLRPILKNWLDDNLPQIVERIVREEIGRLALDAQRR
jgi:cell pole-organizing protein PopZ